MSVLFTPATFGTLTIKNRIVRSATAERMANVDGFPKPELAQLYRDMAKGGVGFRCLANRRPPAKTADAVS